MGQREPKRCTRGSISPSRHQRKSKARRLLNSSDVETWVGWSDRNSAGRSWRSAALAMAIFWSCVERHNQGDEGVEEEDDDNADDDDDGSAADDDDADDIADTG